MTLFLFNNKFLITTFKNADQLFVETVRELGRTPMQTIFGYSAKLQSVNNCFTWNKRFNMNPIRAYGEFLYMISFESNYEQAKAFNPELAMESEYVENGFGIDLRHQLVTILCELERNLWADSLIISSWRGIEDLHLSYFYHQNEEQQPSPLINILFYWNGKSLNAICNYRSLNINDFPYEVLKCSSLLSLIAGFRNLPSGTIQFNCIELESRTDSLAYMINDGWREEEEPLLIDDSYLQCSPELAIIKLEDAIVSEETIRNKDGYFDFGKRRKDLDRYGENTTLSTALSICFVRECSDLFNALNLVNNQEQASGSPLTLSGARKSISHSLSKICDERLLERAMSFVGRN